MPLGIFSFLVTLASSSSVLPPRASRSLSLSLLQALVKNDHYAPHSLSFSHHLRFSPPRIAGSLSLSLIAYCFVVTVSFSVYVAFGC